MKTVYKHWWRFVYVNTGMTASLQFYGINNIYKLSKVVRPD